MVKLYKHVLGARGEIVPQRPAVYITHKRTHAIHLIITGAVPDLYINNLRRAHAFDKSRGRWDKPSGHARTDNARFDLRQAWDALAKLA